jgi:hypothetical protein
LAQILAPPLEGDLTLIMRGDRLVNNLLDVRAAHKYAISIVELILRRDDFFNARLGQFALDEVDKLIRGHHVQLDALALQEKIGFLSGRAMPPQCVAELMQASFFAATDY